MYREGTGLWYEIAETDEWITDKETAEAAMEQGLSVGCFDAGDLVKRVQRLEKELADKTEVVQNTTKLIYERCVEIHNSEHPLQKNMSATMITHNLKELRKAFDL